MLFFRFLLFFIVVALVEIYFLQALKTITLDYTLTKKKFILSIAYVLLFFNLFIVFVAMFYPPPQWNMVFRFVAAIGLIFFICKLIGSSFLVMDDLVRLGKWVVKLFKKTPTSVLNDNSEPISRMKFFSQLAVTFTIIPAVSFIYGMVRGAYKYRIHKVKVTAHNLPEAFEGFKIVHLSDIHCGSFMDTKPLIKAFDLVMEQQPDAIFFTGDLVNNETKETEPHLETYKRLKAPFGVYSCLGNHDYGDYVVWDSPEAKLKNLNDLKKVHEQSGWRLLMNEHVAIEKNGQKIGILGIENWGGNLRFPRYGRLDYAHEGSEQYPFKILLSHDPSHWDVQVSKDERFNDIDLTLSGHTHGMQFGIEIPGFKWSPSQYIYKQWAGLYKKDNQYLYVNRGLGFLGYPGRLGIWPEITVIELSRS